jgi:phospholipase/carboxylesterase
VLKTHEIEARAGEPKGTVIWMHGLGASNHDFDSLIPLLDAPHVRFVFPAAPVRAVTVNGGLAMPAWYDIPSLDRSRLTESEPDVRRSAEQIVGLIESEHQRGVAYEKIVLAGFSQGAAMALHVGVRFPQRLAGLMVLSGYLLLADKAREECSDANTQTPILCCHGTFDPIVNVTFGRETSEQLTQLGFRPQLVEYPMDHSICMEEVERIRGWLAQCLPAGSR